MRTILAISMLWLVSADQESVQRLIDRGMAMGYLPRYDVFTMDPLTWVTIADYELPLRVDRFKIHYRVTADHNRMIIEIESVAKIVVVAHRDTSIQKAKDAVRIGDLMSFHPCVDDVVDFDLDLLDPSCTKPDRPS